MTTSQRLGNGVPKDYSPDDHDPGECRVSGGSATKRCSGCRERRELNPDVLTVVLLVLWLVVCSRLAGG